MKAIVHNPLAHQHQDHSHLGNDKPNFKIDRRKTDEYRKRMMENYNKGWGRPGNSFNDLMRDRERGIHPTEYDKYL